MYGSSRAYRSSLVTALAVTFATMSAVLAATAAVTGNWLALVPAAMFAATAYFMWYHASGRLADRVYRSAERAATPEEERGSGRRRRRTAATDGRGGFGAGPREDWERPGASTQERVRGAQARRENERRRRAREHARRVGGRGGRGPVETAMSAQEAANVLGVGVDADEDEVRSAYRDRIKEVHPDTDGGDEDDFKRVRDAYERLSD